MTPEEEILSLTKKLITVPTETGDHKGNNQAIEIIASYLKDFTPRVFESKGYKSILFSNTTNKDNEYKIILNAHLDVVAAKPEQYTPKINNGNLYGRGAYDTKACVAAFAALFKNLAANIQFPLALQLVTDEETGGFNGTGHQVHEGIRGEFVIAGEPTDLLINNKAKGIMWIEIKIPGISSHGAYPWNGKNAILEMNRFLDRLLAKFPLPAKESWQTTINIAKITTSNTATNKVPDECTSTMDVRFVLGDEKEVLAAIEDLLPKEATYNVLVSEPAHDTPENNEYIKQLNESMKKITGKKVAVIPKHGGSDIRFYNAVGNHGITFGPIGANHHADDEYVDIKSIETFYRTLEDFLTSI